MTWFVALLLTAAVSAPALAVLAAIDLLALPGPPSPFALLATQAGVFLACRWWLGVRLAAALLRSPSRASDEPDWLRLAVLWLAERAPRWLLAFALILGSLVWATSPLLNQGPLCAALWGLALLATLTFIAAALAPDPAWRLALPDLPDHRPSPLPSQQSQ